MNGDNEDSIADALRAVIEEVKPYLESNSYENETAVRNGVIDPILEALGWNKKNPLQVKVELTLEGRRLDYALCPKADGRLYVIIEAKSLGKAEDADKQLFQYCFDAGAQLAIISDGRSWKFYYPPAVGEPSDRLVVRLDLVETPFEKCLKSFRRYLAFEEVRSGRAHDNAKHDLEEGRTRLETKKHIPQAWNALVDGEDEAVVGALITWASKAHVDGRAPQRRDVIAFLKTLRASASPSAIASSTTIRSPSPSPSPSMSPRPSSPSSAELNRPAPQPAPRLARSMTTSSRRIGRGPTTYWVLGERGEARNYGRAYVAVLVRLANTMPQAAEYLQRKRSIGRNKEDVVGWPHVEKNGDWFVNRNIKKRRHGDQIERLVRVPQNCLGRGKGYKA